MSDSRGVVLTLHRSSSPAQPLYQLNMARLLEELMTVVIRHQIQFLPEYSTLIKVLITIEGIARDLDPSFDLIGEATPFVQNLIKDKYSPKMMASRSKDIAINYFEFLEMFPQEAAEYLKKMNDGKLLVNLKHEDLDASMDALDRITNRLSFAIVIASIIVGTSLLLGGLEEPYKFFSSIVGFMGVTVAWFLGVWLLYAIFRSGKM